MTGTRGKRDGMDNPMGLDGPADIPLVLVSLSYLFLANKSVRRVSGTKPYWHIACLQITSALFESSLLRLLVIDGTFGSVVLNITLILQTGELNILTFMVGYTIGMDCESVSTYGLVILDGIRVILWIDPVLKCWVPSSGINLLRLRKLISLILS